MDIATRCTVQRLLQLDNFVVLFDPMRFERHNALRIFSICRLHIFQFDLRLHYPRRHCINLIFVLETGGGEFIVLLHQVNILFLEPINFGPKVIIRLQFACF